MAKAQKLGGPAQPYGAEGGAGGSLGPAPVDRLPAIPKPKQPATRPQDAAIKSRLRGGK